MDAPQPTSTATSNNTGKQNIPNENDSNGANQNSWSRCERHQEGSDCKARKGS
jgi:hypothetical protein